MSTFGVMQSNIADNINKTNLTAQIKRHIVAAMDQYRHKRFRFNYASSTFTTSDGQSVYPLPEGYIGDELIEVLDGNFRGVLTKRDYSWVADHDNHESYKSEPRVYAIIDNANMRLYPTADADSYTMIVHYHKDLNASGISGAISISASSDITNAWMTTGAELIELDATIRVYLKTIRGQEAAAEASKLLPLRNAALRALTKEYNQAVGSGSVQSYFHKR